MVKGKWMTKALVLAGLCFGLSGAEPRLYAAMAGGEIPRLTMNDVGETGAFWQGGLSAEYATRFVLVYAQPWLGSYVGGLHFELAAGAGAGLPIPWIRGHAWLLAETAYRSMNVATFPYGTDEIKPVRKSAQPWGFGARLDAAWFYGSFVGFDDVYPSWRLEAGLRLFPWPWAP